MRLTKTLVAVLIATGALTACSKREEAAYNNAASEDAAPDIAPSAAPNVAFSYAYRFALAAKEIAAVQEKHAAACEALGLSRCRITGVVYRRHGNDDVEAELVVKLAPDIARKFGKDATAAVEAVRGTLDTLEIGGEDQSRALQSSEEGIASARTERERLEKALTDRATPAAVSAQLTQQIATQQDAERTATREGRDARALIAATPMHFTYSTDGYVPGFSLDRTAKGALSIAATVLNALLAIVIVLVALAFPVGLLVLAGAYGRQLALWLWQRLAPKPLALRD